MSQQKLDIHGFIQTFTMFLNIFGNILLVIGITRNHRQLYPVEVTCFISCCLCQCKYFTILILSNLFFISLIDPRSWKYGINLFFISSCDFFNILLALLFVSFHTFTNKSQSHRYFIKPSIFDLQKSIQKAKGFSSFK